MHKNRLTRCENFNCFTTLTTLEPALWDQWDRHKPIPITQRIIIIKWALKYIQCGRVIWDLLDKFDPIIGIPLSRDRSFDRITFFRNLSVVLSNLELFAVFFRTSFVRKYFNFWKNVIRKKKCWFNEQKINLKIVLSKLLGVVRISKVRLG